MTTGAESLLRTAAAAGVELCLVNPGTTELPLVTALAGVGGMRAVLALAESVLAGAADGYGRMTRKPALTVTHQGPSFANAIANLHNARRAGTPVVNVVGEQPTWHRAFDPPLATDVLALARSVSRWTRVSSSAATISQDIADAIGAAVAEGGGIATLVVPADCQWGEAGAPPSAPAIQPLAPVAPAVVEEAARTLRQGQAVTLLLGGRGLSAHGLASAGRIATATGCRLLCETFPARLERGTGLPPIARMPYVGDAAAALFGGATGLVLAGARDPVSFFGYPDGKSRLVPPDVTRHALAEATSDVEAALAAVADALGAAQFAAPAVPRPQRLSGPLSARTLVAALASLLPEGAIVVDESVSMAGAYLPVSAGAPRHSYLALTGGACGFALACAAGAALACPDRKVIALVGDGSALYAPQALWTQAREQLDVVNVIVANGAYRILELEAARLTGAPGTPEASRLLSLASPSVDFAALAKGFGVPSERVETTDAMIAALERALATKGPSLVEVHF